MTEMPQLKAADNDTMITSAIAEDNDDVQELLGSLSEDEDVESNTVMSARLDRCRITD